MDVPLPNQRGLIAGVSKRFGKCWILQAYSIFAGGRIGQIAQCARARSAVLPAQQACPRWRADGVVGTGDIEPDAVFRQSVDVWRSNDIISVTADFEGSELVTKADNHIGLVGLWHEVSFRVNRDISVFYDALESLRMSSLKPDAS